MFLHIFDIPIVIVKANPQTKKKKFALMGDSEAFVGIVKCRSR